MGKKLDLNNISVCSFVTALPGKRQKRLFGGVEGGTNDAVCGITLAEGCSDQEGCSDYNHCGDHTGCCRPEQV